MVETVDCYEEYWMKLYPEMKSIEELNTYIQSIFKKNLYDMLKDKKIKNTSIKQYEQNLDIFLENKQLYNIEFIRFYGPIIAKYFEKISNIIEDIILVENIKQFIESIVIQLANLMRNITFRTMVYEINLSKEKNILKGNNSQERYKYFNNELLANYEYRRNLYNKYPFLIKILDVCAENFVNYLEEILVNTNNDIDKIEYKVNLQKPLGKLKNIEFSLGDAHCKGKSVAKLIFRDKIIFYKPRNCIIDIKFQEVLNLFNKAKVLGNKKYKLLNIHGTSKCGWISNVKFNECINTDEVHEYYLKIGGLISILYFFNAKDFHHENIIACGKNPMLIDLESIFSSDLQKEVFDEKSAYNNAINYLKTSVQSIGILPNKLHIGDITETYETGGIVYKEKQIAPIKSLNVVNAKSDNIHMELMNIIIKGNSNASKCNGNIIDPKEYLDDIITGFKLIYKWVLDNKKNFIEFVENSFDESRIRIILKPTFLYSQVLSIAKHQKFMSNEIENKLINGRIGLYEDNIDITKAEINSLKRYDIPYFSALFNKKYLFDEDENILESKLIASPQELFKNKVKQATEKDMKNQIDFINISFFKKQPKDFRTGITYIDNNSEIDYGDNYLEVAKKIGDYLCNTAIKGENQYGKKDAVWITSAVSKVDVNDWTYSVSDLDLYNGNSGIALFLLNLWKVTGDKKYLNVALQASELIISVIKNKTFNYSTLIGGFNGIGSYIYIISKLVYNVDDEYLNNILIEALSLLKEKIDTASEMDLVAGCSGMLAVLLNVYKENEDKSLQQKVKPLLYMLFDKIEESIKNNDKIISYSGFAHGIAGCIPFLYKLYLLDKNKGVYALFKYLLSYERDHFYNKEENNWIISNEDKKYPKAWCHGVPGILLEKVILKDSGYKDEYLDEEIKIALKRIKKNCIGNNIVYCHGDIGNLDIIQYATKILKDKKMHKQCLSTYNKLFKLYINNNWNSEECAYNKCKGIMLGLSGIGLSLLRMGNKYDIDDFLWLS